MCLSFLLFRRFNLLVVKEMKFNKTLFILLFLSLFLVNCSDGQTTSSVDLYVPFVQDGKWGLAHWDGKVIFEAKWDKVLAERAQSMHEYGLFSFIDSKGIYVVHGPSQAIHGPFVQVKRTWAPGLTCRVGNTMGFINSEGQMEIPVEYKDVTGNRFNNRLVLRNAGGAQAFYQLGSANLPTEFPYRKLRPILFQGEEDGAFMAVQNGKWGMLGLEEEIRIPFEYDELEKLGNGNRPTYILGIKKLADNQIQADLFHPNGQILFSRNSSEMEVFSKQLIKVLEDGKGWQLLNAEGTLISPDFFRTMNWLPKRDFDAPQILSAETAQGKKLYFDAEGQAIPIEEAEAIIAVYKDASLRSNMAIVKVNNLQGVIVRESGDTLIPAKFQHLKFVGDCIVANQKMDSGNMSISLFDSHGKLLLEKATRIKQIYIDYSSNSFPLFEIKMGSSTSYRDLSGRELLSQAYEAVKPEIVRDDETGEAIPILKVKQDGKWGYLDLEGSEIIEVKYDDVKPLISNRLFLVKLEGKQFVVNTDGKAYGLE